MRKLLLTGFEPFLDYKVNPTMKIVKELDGLIIGEYQIIGKIMTVDFKSSGEQLLSFMEEVQPDVHISLGLAAGRYKITPERIAINIKDGEADNEGNKLQDEIIQESGEAGYLTSLPIRKMVNKLIENGLPAEISNSAGTYLCNNVMYEGLHYVKATNSSMLSGFIHIPASHELAIGHGRIPSWSQADLKQSIIMCIEVLEEHGK